LSEANDVIGNTILELGARGVSAVQYVPPVSPGSASYMVPDGKDEKPLTAETAKKNAKGAKDAETGNSKLLYRYPLQVMGEQILVETPLVGRHQLRNVALAIAAAEELSKLPEVDPRKETVEPRTPSSGVAQTIIPRFPTITPESIERGIRETHWPGRFQALAPRDGWPEMVLDVAHNPAGAWALRSALSERYGDRPLIFVFGAMRDKAISEITEILFPLADRVIATRAENPRSASPEEIQQAGVRTGTEIETSADVAAALDRARDSAGPNTVAVVTGSIFLVGEAMRVLRVKA
jgi:dihydrofolate synthase/folylpolyglutamate synthase